MTHLQPFGKYRLSQRLGVNDVVEVFKGSVCGVRGFDNHVIVRKILPQHTRNVEFIEDLIARVSVAVELSNTNIVPTYEIGRIDGQYFVSSAFVPGWHVGQVLRAAQHNWLSIDHAVLFAVAVCRGLAYANQRVDGENRPAAISHGAVGQRTVRVGRTGNVAIDQFGLAGAVRKLGALAVTDERSGYLTPEEISGGAPDMRSDQFAVGQMLYAMLAGRAAFSGQSDAALRDAVTICDPPRVLAINRRVPEMLDGIVMRALSREPIDRFGSPGDFERQLVQFLLDTGSTASTKTLSLYLRQLFPGQSDESPARSSPSIPSGASSGRIGIVTDTHASISATKAARPGRRIDVTQSYAIRAELQVASDASPSAKPNDLPNLTEAANLTPRQQRQRGTSVSEATNLAELLEPLDEHNSSEFANENAAADTEVDLEPDQRRVEFTPHGSGEETLSQHDSMQVREQALAPLRRRPSTLTGTMRLFLHGIADEDEAPRESRPPRESSMMRALDALDPRQTGEHHGVRPTWLGWVVIALICGASVSAILYKRSDLFRPVEESDELTLALDDLEPLDNVEQPQSGHIELQSEPPGATILLHVGDTPVTVDQLELGRSHVLRVEREGYSTKYAVVRREDFSNKQAKVHVVLDPMTGPATDPPQIDRVGERSNARGEVRVTSDPPSSSVWLVVGVAPLALKDRAAKSHYFLAMLPGHQPEYVRVSASEFGDAGETIFRTATLTIDPSAAIRNASDAAVAANRDGAPGGTADGGPSKGAPTTQTTTGRKP